MEPLRTCWTMVVGSDHCNLHTGKNQTTSFKRQQQDKHHLSKMCSPLFFILKSWCTHRSCSCCSWDKTTEPTESDSCLANQRREPWEHIPSYCKYLQLVLLKPQLVVGVLAATEIPHGDNKSCDWLATFISSSCLWTVGGNTTSSRWIWISYI